MMQQLDLIDSYGILPVIKRRIKSIYGTQRNFARELGVTDSHLSDALNGRSAYPREMLPKLKIRRKTYFIVDAIDQEAASCEA